MGHLCLVGAEGIPFPVLMKNPRPWLIIISPLIVIFAVLAMACSDDDDDPQQGSESAVCGDIDAYEDSVDQVEDLDSSSSLDEITSSLTSLRTTATELGSSLREIKNYNADEFQAARVDLEQALVTGLASGSVAQTEAQLDVAVEDIQQDISDAKSSANCD